MNGPKLVIFLLGKDRLVFVSVMLSDIDAINKNVLRRIKLT